ncbi:MAG: membrane protein [Candidatus Cloacimonadota bacterium]|nr:MAG: membrane protein [Candidatus Cloacimonadota bacterium]PIE82038.1 MAG: membrane protein [Candidatus Delongbacteria bacterium]
MLSGIKPSKVKNYTGAFVFLFSFVIYLITVAPTTSYWDCGEFIATSHILGVPHPPGAPLFLLLGRIFSILPIAGDIGLRVNLISVISSSFTVLFLFLISVRLIVIWRGKVENFHDMVIVYGGSLIGALTFAFTDTFWFNAVEAEVYALSMFFTSFIIWLLMKWIETHKDPDSSRYLLLIMLAVGLGTGVHLLNILTLPSAIFLMWFYDRRMAIITGIGMVLSIGALFGMDPEAKIYALLLFTSGAIYYYRSENQDYSLAFIAPVLLIIGYSTYMLIYIRAGLNPPINENDPSTIERMIDYLSRKQYGDEKQFRNALFFMFGEENRKYLESVAKMGLTAGSPEDPWKSHWSFFWNYQVVEMYVRYFNWQFIGKNIDNIKQIITIKGLYGIPFLIGLWGAISHFFKDWKRGIGLLSLFIVLGLGLIIYQNQDWGQPRERDYFYVGSFFIFSIWIGMGVTFVLDSIKELKLKSLVIPLFIISLIVPALEINANIFQANRTGNYLAWDYSKNILESCDKDAVLFTNGDNDTFPLWYLQEVEGIRKDITIVNLSLLNTDWYVKQMKLKIPNLITYSNSYINKNFSQDIEDVSIILKRLWEEPREIELPVKDGKTIKWTMKPTIHVNIDGEPTGMIKVQDQMVLHILANNAKMGWKHPICFAVTVSSANYIGLDQYLRMDGLVYRVMDYKANRSIEPKVVYNRIFKKFKDHYRNLGDKSVYYDENKIRLLQNYRSAFMQLATHYLDTSSLKFQPNDSTVNVELDQDLLNKDLSFEEFEKLKDRTKIGYVLSKMESIIPVANIRYTNPLIITEIAGLLKYSGQPKRGYKLLVNTDISKETNEKKIQFLMRANKYGYQKFSEEKIEELFKEIKNQGSIVDNIRDLTDLYMVSTQVGNPLLSDKIKHDIETSIEAVNNNRIKIDLYKEWAVGIYSSGNTDEAIRVLDRVANKYRDTESLSIKFQIQIRENMEKEALKTVNQILEINPNDKKYQDIRDELLKRVGRE